MKINAIIKKLLINKKKRTNMKKSEKGFTLIELLVVVAIIGILAAVGVVAYSGYTAGAKKSASKSNQGAVVKYIAAEMKKCAFGDSTVMKNTAGTGELTCSGMTGTTVAAAAIKVLAPEFKNPYDTATSAIAAGAKAAQACSDTNRGQTLIGTAQDATTNEWTVYVHTCYDNTNVSSNQMLVE